MERGRPPKLTPASPLEADTPTLRQGRPQHELTSNQKRPRGEPRRDGSAGQGRQHQKNVHCAEARGTKRMSRCTTSRRERRPGRQHHENVHGAEARDTKIMKLCTASRRERRPGSQHQKNVHRAEARSTSIIKVSTAPRRNLRQQTTQIWCSRLAEAKRSKTQNLR